MAGSPWISRTGVRGRVRVRVRAERGKSGSGSVSESGSMVRVIRRGVYACKCPQHRHRPNTRWFAFPRPRPQPYRSPSPIVPLPPNRQWVVRPSLGSSPGNQRSGTRSRTRGWEWREIMAWSPWISRTGVRGRVRVRAERGKSGSGSVSESGSMHRVIRRGVYACKCPHHFHRANT
jgi:hypothetical protein